MPKPRQRTRRGTGSHRIRNGRHQIRRVIAGRLRGFTADTLAEAEALAEAARRGAEAQSVAASPTVRDWLAEWLTRQRARVRPQTYFAYEAHARLHIVPVIGQIRLDALTPLHIDTLHAQLARRVGGTTAHHVHMTLNAALNAAARRGHRVSNALAPSMLHAGALGRSRRSPSMRSMRYYEPPMATRSKPCISSR